MKPRLGIIGGSGLYESEFLEAQETLDVVTPYGKPSAPLEMGKFGKEQVAFMPRHAPEHSIPPHRINHLANLWAMKEVGVERVVTTSSVGSLKLEIRPGEFIIPDDYLSPWNIPTYHDEEVVHVTPKLDPSLRVRLLESAQKAGVQARDGGVYIQTIGPRLETVAEIRMFREFGDVVGMTMASEATLARELDLPYASICTIDNYCHGVVDEPLAYAEIVSVQREKADDLTRVLHAFLEAAP
ncbi:MAG: MTAP family purine nucleoside phosphorylase [Candidatus Thermoplasmatota archaeon]|nr:MTAP family purine nucleoside phosphorylase [Candidatus Thermoplasmatota archaeon]